ncbi:MAG: dihydroorotase [Bacteroidetes bacterium GWA2_32_17]|nr:MAG: dihydroorotase [Bacteroidetes bacterium GWA2_32_17]
MHNYYIKGATIVNENKIFIGNVLIVDGKIKEVSEQIIEGLSEESIKIIDAKGFHLFPGVIDDQVHFREPGLTHKAEIYTEAKAAVAGGITSFMEMPNTKPPALTHKLLQEKFDIASQKSLANYSFYLGASNDNLSTLLSLDNNNVCGIKVFMGASTGNMLVDNESTLSELFKKSKSLIAVHCEEESIIRANASHFLNKFGENITIKYHPLIRSAEACYASSKKAVDLAKKYDTRLHVLHLSTAKEMELFSDKPIKDKRITNEVCVHHLWFNDEDYEKYGNKIKWNPAIKSKNDREKLRESLNNNILDIVATDHAPHTIEEKSASYFQAPSGGPLVQHSLVAMLEMYHQNIFSLEKITDKMCHSPAEVFQVKNRGYIRPDYWADLVLVDLNNQWKVETNNILYKCKWSPFEGQTFKSKVVTTFVNGIPVYYNGVFEEQTKGKALEFSR